MIITASYTEVVSKPLSQGEPRQNLLKETANLSFKKLNILDKSTLEQRNQVR